MDKWNPSFQATCLLCAHMPKEATEPLSATEFTKVRQWLDERRLPLESLLEPNWETLVQELEPRAEISAERLKYLLQRSVSLASWLERWLNAGMWILSQDDEAYPRILIERLGTQAPVLLYGFGNMDLLNQGGLAIVGSRNASDVLLEFTRDIANRCASERWNVITGGARGVDRAAMNGALQENGTCVSVLPADLGRVAVSPSLRESLLADKVCLVSLSHPESGFTVGNAMARNKVVYALSEYALVVSCERERGGTWAGAVENLKKQWVPLFVYTGDGAPADNEHLVGRNAYRFPSISSEPLRQTLQEIVSSNQRGSGMASPQPTKRTAVQTQLDFSYEDDTL